MSLLTSSIDLDTIVPPNPSQFESSQLEHLANLFLRAGDTVRPILLSKISPISFQILEGDFEYYAAMKAQEIDAQFTAIRAYVVPPDLESTILEQYHFLRSRSFPNPITPQIIPQKLDQIEQAIANRLEQKLTATIERTIEQKMDSSLQSLQTLVNQLTSQLESHLIPAGTIPAGTIVELPIQPVIPLPKKSSKPDKPSKTLAKAPPKTPTKNKNTDDHDPRRLQVLNDLNTINFADLERKLGQSKNGKFARPIHEQRSQQLFASIPDTIANVKGLAEKTMQKIIDAW